MTNFLTSFYVCRFQGEEERFHVHKNARKNVSKNCIYYCCETLVIVDLSYPILHQLYCPTFPLVVISTEVHHEPSTLTNITPIV